MPEVKELIEKLLDKVQKDDSIKELFTKDPVKAVEKVLGVDLLMMWSTRSSTPSRPS